MPYYRRYYVPGHPVFLTLVTHGRRPWLATSSSVGVFLESLRRVKALHPFNHLGHVVLPDHVHLLLDPADANFSIIVAALKRSVVARFKEQQDAPGKPLWQPRFYDHVIRNADDFWKHLDYIHYNPVKHGVAIAPGEHPHGTFSEWCKRGVYEPDWGRQEPADIADMNLE